MKICQLCAVDFTLYHFILPLMRAEQAAGHEVVGVCSDGEWLHKVREQGFRTVPLAIARNLNPLRHWLSYHRLVRLFREERFDMVHVHTPIAALLGRLAARRAGVGRIVYTAHGFYFHERMAPCKRALFIALEKWGGRHTDVLFTQAEEDAASARGLGLCRGGVIEAIGNGVDPARFSPPAGGGVSDARARLRAELETPEDAVVVMMTGRMVAEKGYPELFAAMAGQDAILWATGERLASDHAAGVSSAAPPANVRLLGHRRDVPDLLRAADIFTLPSHREGMPRSIIEAMMVGLPVIATDIRGSREEVVAGETGLLVPVADKIALAGAIRELSTDAERRRRMGAAGRRRALELYDESKVIQRQMERLALI
ncbi:MAG: glycosyltransferase family 4 protein [Alphaproteobacteria bacterium]|jgi:glycosyltransferase involved in cell wall biosynthesis|nr:glycosyltransferase family 4 protein [Alphaproteobacteria bacterium]